MTLVPVVLIEQRDKHVHAQQRPRRSDAQIIANLVDDLVGDHRPAGRGRPEPVPLARPPGRRPAASRRQGATQQFGDELLPQACVTAPRAPRGVLTSSSIPG